MPGTTVHFVDTDDAIVVKTSYAIARARYDIARRRKVVGLGDTLVDLEIGPRPISIPVERIAYLVGR